MRRKKEREPVELPQGALELIVLGTLERGARHGYALVQEIGRRSGEEVRAEEGSLYPALHRLERRELVRSEWGVTDTKRRAKFYSLTRKGRAELARRRTAWARMTSAVGRALGLEPSGA